MRRSFRERLAGLSSRTGHAGLAVAVVALVVALSGGAYAATGGGLLASSSGKHHKKKQSGLNGKQKKEVKKIAKSFAGKKGATGAKGEKGDAGAKGEKGDAGANGANGTNGTNGTDVTSKALSAGDSNCPAGGSEFTSASGVTYACNGGHVNELAAGETETGAWGVGPVTEEAETEGYPQYSVVSFPVPLPEGEGHAGGNPIAVEFMEVAATPTVSCPGSAEEPLAAEGTMCVYQSYGYGFSYFGALDPADDGAGAGRNGAILSFSSVEAFGSGGGTWAVTAR